MNYARTPPYARCAELDSQRHPHHRSSLGQASITIQHHDTASRGPFSPSLELLLLELLLLLLLLLELLLLLLLLPLPSLPCFGGSGAFAPLPAADCLAVSPPVAP